MEVVMVEEYSGYPRRKHRLQRRAATKLTVVLVGKITTATNDVR
jgi:hypothetical protein